MLNTIMPFFIVSDVTTAMVFYRDALGFSVTYMAPEDAPFFAMIRRDGASLMLKAIGPDVRPQPNPSRHPWARWDAYVDTPDPDGLATELAARGTVLHKPLGDTDDGLRGFEIRDLDGYVLFFGRPI
ncbi:MAG TPA: VOC family protein [Asticcacaulis sp.]|nr:VOC family protein [Asticcacaulis sp.]